MHKKQIKQAIENYLIRQNPKPQVTRKEKNNKPEKLVEEQVLSWCKQQGWFVSVVESKAVYSASAGRFLRGQAQAGFPDIVGSNHLGQFVAIELKAKGRLSTLRPAQYEYLKQGIKHHSFCLVVDSLTRLSESYRKYTEYQNPSERQEFLLSLLPVPKILRVDDSPLFP